MTENTLYIARLQQLKQQLFDISKRNKLLKLASRQKLAALSGPFHTYFWDELLRTKFAFIFTAPPHWDDELEHNEGIVLLEKLRLEAQRDEKEFGFHQVHTCLATIDWCIPGNAPEWVTSPLLLIETDITKRKGIQPSWKLDFTDAWIEVNPVIAYLWKIHFGITLPTAFDPETTTLEQAIYSVQQAFENAGHAIAITQAIPAEPATLPLQDFTLFAYKPAPSQAWSITANCLLIGNFNYRKMALVEDYEALVENTEFIPPLLDRLLISPVQPAMAKPASIPIPLVTMSDSSQQEAILKAKQGESFVLQGPPGTGKSQTITNLIAACIQQGKTVLFVCEKRAALDVVYQKLKQVELHDLCAVVHQNANDKKACIESFKTTYLHFLKQESGIVHAEKKHQSILEQTTTFAQYLQRFFNPLTQVDDEFAPNVMQFLNDYIALGYSNPNLNSPSVQLPSTREWEKASDALIAFQQFLNQQPTTPSVFQHPFWELPSWWIHQPDLGTFQQDLTTIQQILELEWPITWGEKKLNELLGFIELTPALPSNWNWNWVLPDTNEAKAWKNAWNAYQQLEKNIKKAERNLKGWKQVLTATEAQQALASYTYYQSKWWRFLSGTYRRLQKTLHQAHPIPNKSLSPDWPVLLAQVLQYHQLIEERDEFALKLQNTYGFSSVLEIQNTITEQQKRIKNHQYEQLSAQNLQWLFDHAAYLKSAAPAFKNSWTNGLQKSIAQWSVWIEQLTPHLTYATLAKPYLVQLAPVLTPRLHQFLQEPYSNLAEGKRIIYENAFALLVKKHPVLLQFDPAFLLQSARNWQTHQFQLFSEEANRMKAKTHHVFKQHIALTERPASVLTPEEKELKKQWQPARRVLEHEFSKSMRFKGLRELNTAPTGSLLRTFKPVWLMSPLSVADALPLIPSLFDVVIFDEASQIRLEEAIPTLARAKQAIVVGDTMQMPPGDFFQANHWDETEDEEEEPLQLTSLLDAAIQKWPTHTLRWHYRSRHEALITFSNHTFYKGQLFTVPASSSYITRAPLHWHYMPDGQFLNRKNIPEAQQVLALVKSYFNQPQIPTIGIVAFSMEQQQTIWALLEKEAKHDAVFASQLEQQLQREEDGRFMGLFIKNLENVQGDEREVMIISMAYGPDADGKIKMHFGPLNRQGGEKRLNVLVTRAQECMHIISSMLPEHITNTHNDGARTLKQFLSYVQTHNQGISNFAEHISHAPTPQPFTQAIANALRNQGLYVNTQHGASEFKIDLVVGKHENDCQWAILTELPQNDWLESFVLREQRLVAKGWKVYWISPQAWILDAPKVIEQLLAQMQTQ